MRRQRWRRWAVLAGREARAEWGGGRCTELLAGTNSQRKASAGGPRARPCCRRQPLCLQVYSGGGSTSLRTPSLDWRLLAGGAARFEDGTLPYLNIIGVRQVRPAMQPLCILR